MLTIASTQEWRKDKTFEHMHIKDTMNGDKSPNEQTNFAEEALRGLSLNNGEVQNEIVKSLEQTNKRQPNGTLNGNHINDYNIGKFRQSNQQQQQQQHYTSEKNSQTSQQQTCFDSPSYQVAYQQQLHLPPQLYHNQQGSMILSELYHHPSQVGLGGQAYNVLPAAHLAMHPSAFQTPVVTTARSPGRAQYRTTIPDRAIQYGSYVEPGSIPTLNHCGGGGAGSLNGGQESNNNSQRGSPRDERLSQTNLYIRKLKDEDTDETIRQLLVEAGVQCQSITTTKAVRDESGTCRSYGFADFNSHEAALVAKEKLKHIRNGELEISFAKEAEKDPTNVYIRNIPEDDTQFNEQWLSRTFSQYGTVVSSRVLRTNHRDPIRNITIQKPTGTGFIRFERESEALACIDGINNRKQDLGLPLGSTPLDAKLADKGSKKRTHTGGLTTANALHSAVINQLPGGYSQIPGSQLIGYANGMTTPGSGAGTSLLTTGYAPTGRQAASAGQIATMYMPTVAGPALYQTSAAGSSPVGQSAANYLHLQAAAQQQHQHSSAAVAAVQLANQQAVHAQATQHMLQQLNAYPSYGFMPTAAIMGQYGAAATLGDPSSVSGGAAQHATFYYPDLSSQAAYAAAAAAAAQAATE